MGRLFWKFFLLATLAQFITVLGVSAAIWWRSDGDMHDERGPGARGDAAAAALERGGVAEVRGLLESWTQHPGPTVYVLDAQGRDVLGRSLPRLPPAVPRAVVAQGTPYTIVEEAGGPGGGPGPGRPPHFPVEPILGGLVASLVLAALLAVFVAKPIRHLRLAFDALADGRLDTRIGSAMERGRDELTDLGRDFDRTAERLQALVEGQRRLLHMVSHEMRSPLARLQVAIGLARQSPANLEPSLERVEREAERMDRLVDELLTLSRLDARVDAAREADIDLAELLAGVVADATYEADGDGRSVSVTCDAEAAAGARVAGEPEMLHRALDNVLRNALHHAGTPGSVRVSAIFDPASGETVITIADDGDGVPPEELDAIFEPFYRGAGARRGGGYGLGLAITRRVVEAHGGRVTARNGTNGGLCVDVRLPVTPGPR